MANLPYVKVAQNLTAAILNGIIGRINGQALTGIVPTGAPGGTVGTLGRVLFTNAAGVSVDGVFTTQYDNYRIVWNSSTRSASATLNFRLRQAGADLTTATYDYTKGYDQSNARIVQTPTAATAYPLDISQAAGQSADGYSDIFGPALGGVTSGTGLCFSYAAASPATVATGFRNTTTGAFDGFTIYPTSGTITGTLRVYGYNNLS